jgi:hypothetical protein
MTRRCARCNYPLLTPEPKDRLCEVCAGSPVFHSTQGLTEEETRAASLARLTSDGIDYGHERRAIIPAG